MLVPVVFVYVLASRQSVESRYWVTWCVSVIFNSPTVSFTFFCNNNPILTLFFLHHSHFLLYSHHSSDCPMVLPLDWKMGSLTDREKGR